MDATDSGDKKIALVTGSNRGIGLAMVRLLAQRGVITILSSRNLERGVEAQKMLADEGLLVDFIGMEVTDEASVRQSASFLQEKYGRLDILINNAGILKDSDNNALTVTPDTVSRTFLTNTIGPLTVTQAMLPLLSASEEARVINISSGMGQLTDMTGGYPAYRMSKTALNALTRILAAELTETAITVNAFCPGWVKTDLGGPNAERTPEESAQGIVDWVLDPAPRPSGLLLRDGQVLPW